MEETYYVGLDVHKKTVGYLREAGRRGDGSGGTRGRAAGGLGEIAEGKEKGTGPFSFPFLLSGGLWYKIRKSFVQHVDGSFRSVAVADLGIGPYREEDLESGRFSEDKFNARVCRERPDLFALMHNNKISHGGGHGQIEFCDVLSRTKDIIHIKRYGASSSLSHLFAQGTISGELFRSDSSFREAVNGKLKGEFRLIDTKAVPPVDEYRVVFAVISGSRKELWLPFFSRLNLINAQQRLQNWGYRVALSKIGVDEIVAKRKKF